MFVKRSRLLLIVLLAVALLAVGSAAERSARTITVSGTGFVVGADGYLLTNEHVIHGATSIKVVVGGQDYSAEVKEAREDRDLALLKISGYDLPIVALGDSDTVEIGDQVVAIGCPEGICGTVTQGRVANLGVDATFGDKTLHNLIMIDVTITHGSSGGPLLNMKGEVIGITMGGIEGTSFGFAIPINDAISLLDEVPGFSRSQMGRATEELSLSEIADRVRPAVIYVEGQRVRPLEDLLPREALGYQLELEEPWGVGGQVRHPRYLDTSLFPYTGYWRDRREVLESHGLTVEDLYGVQGTDDLIITVEVFDLADEQQAEQAAQLLADPVATVHSHGPSGGEGSTQYWVCVEWIISCAWEEMQYEHYETALRRTQSLGTVHLNLIVKVVALEVPFKDFKSGEQGYDYYAGFLGAATFSIGDVSFFVVLGVTHKIGEKNMEFLGLYSGLGLRCDMNPEGYVECEYETSGEANSVVVESLKLGDFLTAFNSVIEATLTAAMGEER